MTTDPVFRALVTALATGKIDPARTTIFPHWGVYTFDHLPLTELLPSLKLVLGELLWAGFTNLREVYLEFQGGKTLYLNTHTGLLRVWAPDAPRPGLAFLGAAGSFWEPTDPDWALVRHAWDRGEGDGVYRLLREKTEGVQWEPFGQLAVSLPG